jgi:serralysin
MAITFNGVRLEDKDNGLTRIGDDNVGGVGVGSLTVDGGDILDLTSANLATQKSQALLIGDAAGADGTVTIGAASRIEFNAVGDDTGTQLIIGRNGGSGVMNIAGGTFEIADHSTVGYDTVNEDDEEFVVIGRTAGSNGQLNVSAGGSFLIEGNTVNMQIGRAGGTGSATFTGGSHFNLTAGGAGTDSGVLIRVGNGTGSVGTLTFDNSDGTLQANPDNSASFIIGLNGGKGHFQLLNSSQFTVNGGEQGAFGLIGGGGGAGDVVIESGSQLKLVTAHAAAALVVGQDPGGRGSLDATASTVWLEGTGAADAGITIGRYEGDGTANIGAGSTLHIETENLAYLDVGNGDGVGSLTIEAGATVEMLGSRAYATIGAERGFGYVRMDGGAWNLNADEDARILIGDNGDHEHDGEGALTLRNGSTINFNTHTESRLEVGAATIGSGKLFMSGGSVIDLDAANDPAAEGILRIGTGGIGTVVLDGAGTEIKGIDHAYIGYIPGDSASAPGCLGDLFIRNGAQITVSDVIQVGGGGGLGGNGTVIGSAELLGNANIELRGQGFGPFTITGDLSVDALQNRFNVDVGAGAGNNDVLDVDDYSTTATGQLTIILDVLGGYKFAANEVRTIVDFNTRSGNLPNFSVNNQHADFAYYGGTLPGNPGEFVFEALNSGATGGLGVIDFGTAGPLATVLYDATANGGSAKGGVYGAFGGFAYNVDRFLGTNLNDTLTITGTTARAFSFDGRGGNDTINGGAGVDNVVGGIGLDILKGNAGNDILNGGNDGDQLFGGVGNDSLTGGLGNDFFVFNTALNAATNKDTVVDFNAAQDTFRLENAIFTKLGAAFNPAFFHAGPAAADANDYIVYNKATGALFYDANGSGAGLAIQFATLTNKPTLTASDFVVI